ncbi:hypothetical protein ACFL27_26780 [candidate division CSSED10-310 bacterium]|uniref:Uncharacterized protein n=1 Tax=candidate division CSSED10-310 bacterium TaxID=2855610 RepID=A0ABV6Z5T8_UNCC1
MNSKTYLTITVSQAVFLVPFTERQQSIYHDRNRASVCVNEGRIVSGINAGTMVWICRQVREIVTTPDDLELTAIIGPIEPLLSTS